MLRVLTASVVSLVALGGCTMLTSYNSSLLTDGGAPRDGAGAYHLPKHVIVATVTQEAAAKGKHRKPPEIVLTRKAIADPHYPMNVGLEFSPTSDDTIHIKYTNGLIASIKATADDKSKEIIETVTSIIAGRLKRVGTANDSEGIGDASAKLVQVTFDPFDPMDHHRANSELYRYGFCIAFGRDSKSSVTTGCEGGHHGHNGHHGDDHRNVKGARPAPRRIEQGSGVFYRQPIEHKVQVFHRHAARCHGWCLHWEGYSSFANNGPVLSANVNRTLFVKRDTTFVFGPDGVPTSVKVVKPSELLQMAKTTQTVVSAVIATPVAAVASSVSTVNEQKDLVNAQRSNLDAQTLYLESMNQRLKDGQGVPDGHTVISTQGASFGRIGGDNGNGGYGNRAGEDDARGRARRAFIRNCTEYGLDVGGCELEWKKEIQ